MFQDNPQLIEQITNLKLTTLIAGLVGAFINMLRKTEGSLQARLMGFVIAIGAILYLVPFVVWFIEWRGNIVLPSPVENLLAFIIGVLAQRLTESFIDNPTETVLIWAANLKKLKRSAWNNENFQPNLKGENESNTKKNTEEKGV